MLDMGFIPDIETICSKLPTTRQTLLFSATMPPPIKKLADKFLTNPKYIEVARPATANVNIVQHKVRVQSRNKREVLRQLLRTDNVSTAMIFCNRKTTVRELAKSLKGNGFAAGEIHGDMDQPSRIAELDRFKDGKINILVCSDVAARGLDIKGVSHVFNFDTPWHPDDYVHRIGRTGRAGATGRAFTFVAPDDAEAIANVEKLTGMQIPVYEIGGKSAKAEPAPREDKPARAAKPPRAERAPRAAKVEPEVVEVAEVPQVPVAEAAPRADRPKRDGTKPPKPEPRRAAKRDAVEEGDADVWNGPVPSFLGVSAL